jgi:putative membrane-bound dehydrogenase-like protein
MMELAGDFRIELFAAEPDVVSPVAMEFDEDGRVYVVEDRGYPLDVDGRVGRVKLLQDTNGDGKPDRTTIFADNLILPTGVMRWKKGILVTDPPHLWYFEDTNGDGVADLRRKVLSGFAFTNPQHTANSPVYGLDNWIYVAHENPTTAIIFQKEFGDRGSDIRFEGRPETALKERGRRRPVRRSGADSDDRRCASEGRDPAVVARVSSPAPVDRASRRHDPRRRAGRDVGKSTRRQGFRPRCGERAGRPTVRFMVVK